jgi:hypothetical protein
VFLLLQKEEFSEEDARELEEFMKQKNQSVVKRLNDETVSIIL